MIAFLLVVGSGGLGTVNTVGWSSSLHDIFKSGTSHNAWSKGHNVVYRIPSLVATKNGSLLAIVSERLGGSSDESDTNLVQRRSIDGM